MTGRVARRIGIGPAFAAGSALFPAPLLLVPLAEGPRWLVLGCLFFAEFGAGFGVMMLDISLGSIFAAVIPDRLRSRVAGAYTTVNYGVRPSARSPAARSGAGSGCARRSGSRPRARCWGSSSAAVAGPRAPGTARARGRSRLDLLVDLILDGVGGVLRGLPRVVAEILRALVGVVGAVLRLAQ